MFRGGLNLRYRSFIFPKRIFILVLNVGGVELIVLRWVGGLGRERMLIGKPFRINKIRKEFSGILHRISETNIRLLATPTLHSITAN
jgi:hypothetical protein